MEINVKQKKILNNKSISNKNIYMSIIKENDIIHKNVINLSKKNLDANLYWIKYNSNSCRYDSSFFNISKKFSQNIIWIILVY